MFQLFFQDAVTGPRRPTFVLIQEPPLVRGSIPSFSGYVCFHPPLSLGHPRVATYVDSSVARGLTVTSVPTFSPLLIEVLLSSPSGICTASQKTLRIINIYNPPRAAASTAPRLTPSDAFPPGTVATLVAGDFNLHHYATDPTRAVSRRDYLASEPYFSMADLRGYSLLNTPGVYTRFPLSGSGRPSVLDLAFASVSLMPFLAGWGTPYESTGSDHVPILISLATPALMPPRPVRDWARIDWPKALDALRLIDIRPPPPFLTAKALDTWFECHSSRIKGALGIHTPMKSPCSRSKPWWSRLLSSLRKEHHARTRAHKNHPNPSSAAEMRAAKSAYFKEVRKAKNKHWSDFLRSTDHRTVWKAKRLAAGAQAPRFPSLPGANSPEEVRDALI